VLAANRRLTSTATSCSTLDRTVAIVAGRGRHVIACGVSPQLAR